MDTRASRCAIWKLHAPPSREADINPNPQKGGYPAPHRVTFLTGPNRDFPKRRQQHHSRDGTRNFGFDLLGLKMDEIRSALHKAPPGKARCRSHALRHMGYRGQRQPAPEAITECAN